jgi:hypothetical protein
MHALKKFLSALFAKETLIKIILVQVIVLLFMVMTNRGIAVSHKGFLDLGTGFGAVELKIKQ